MFLAPILFLAALVVTPLQEKKEQPAQVDAKKVEATVNDLETAFKEGTKADERVSAIKKASEVLDAKVVSAMNKGLRDKEDPSVQAATVEAFGHMDHPAALEALHKFYTSEKKRLKEDETLLPMVLKAIGRHGSESSLDLLSDDVFMQKKFPALQARVYSIANIRSKKALEALLEMMNKAGPEQVNDYMELFRLSLVRLTGQDQGPDTRIWQKWWQDNKTKFEVSAEVKNFPEAYQKTWDDYWGVKPKAAEQPSTGKRGEKGGEKKGG